MGVIGDWFSRLNFAEVHSALQGNDYFELIFPFLLVYAVFFTILCKVSIFKNKKTDKPNKAIVFVVALIISFFAVMFEISPGHSVGWFISNLFPQISAVGIGILAIYVFGGLMGKDPFFGLFSGRISAFAVIILGGIGLGVVVFYTGLAAGFFDYDALDSAARWNMILLVGTLISGVIMLIVGMSGKSSASLLPFGFLLLFVDGAYIYNGAQDNLLKYYIDPVVFIVVLCVLIYSWTMSKDEKIKLFETKVKEGEESKKKFLAELGGKTPKEYDNRLYDILEGNLKANKEELEKLRKEK